MPTIRIDLAYHGAGFAGWAIQPGERTVEAELGAALETVLGEPATLTVAGRTDSGVHAWGQVVSLEASTDPPADLARSLNGITADDVAIAAAEPVRAGFDARQDAVSRTYCYRVLSAPAPNPFELGLSLFWPRLLELEAMQRCAGALLGSHDFTAFTPTDGGHRHFDRRVIGAEWRRARPLLDTASDPGGETAELLEFWIEADAFLHGMVRALVGTMLEIGGGRRSVEDFEALLAGAPRKRAGDSARPHGLYLAAVGYGA